jgi:hypothetical protein
MVDRKDRGQKTGDRRQKTEVRSQKTEVRSQESEFGLTDWGVLGIKRIAFSG